MFGIGKTLNPRSSLYATSTDFCQVFQKHMNRLYLLSLLLTGNQSAAEKCFVQGLSDSQESNPVFKEWAEAWAKRMIVQSAIEMINPRPTDFISSDNVGEPDAAQPAQIAAILELSAFDRFAYVLSVLEGYPLQECALLLSCRRDEVNAARMRALQEIVKSVECDTTTSIHSRTPRVGLDGLSQLAATA